MRETDDLILTVLKIVTHADGRKIATVEMPVELLDRISLETINRFGPVIVNADGFKKWPDDTLMG